VTRQVCRQVPVWVPVCEPACPAPMSNAEWFARTLDAAKWGM
jgi:hypothetical protein